MSSSGKFKFLFLLIMLFFTGRIYTAPLSMELQNTNLTDAIRVIAKFLDLNVILSPSIKGTATLTFTNAAPANALDMLLNAHGLAKWKVGNVWYIATRDEMIKRKQEEKKWQEIQDEASLLETRIIQIKYARVEDIAHLLQDENASFLSKRGRVRIDTRTNSICIKELPEHMAEIRAIISRLDVPVQQIMIAARLASVDYDFERELGLKFGSRPQDESANPVKSPLDQNLISYNLAIARLADGSLLDVKLSALENAGHADLISSPSLFTANQQSASIEAGEEVPYQEVSEGGGTAVAFKKAVLGLKVTPQILPGNKVLLQLQINQDRPINKMVQGMPAISTRQIITSVLVRSGQTIVLGGIYETNDEKAQQRLPFISRIPLLGLLLQQQTIRKNKRELLIFVTPKIIMQAI